MFLNQFDSFYITANNKIVLRYKVGYETYVNYILGDLYDYKNLIITPKKIIKDNETIFLQTKN